MRRSDKGTSTGCEWSATNSVPRKDARCDTNLPRKAAYGVGVVAEVGRLSMSVR